MAGKVWILYFKQGERWEHNNRDGADRIARQFGRLSDWFAKPTLTFGDEDDMPPQGDLEHTFIDISMVMDNGKQLNLQCIVDVALDDVEEP